MKTQLSDVKVLTGLELEEGNYKVLRVDVDVDAIPLATSMLIEKISEKTETALGTDINNRSLIASRMPELSLYKTGDIISFLISKEDSTLRDSFFT